ncbi:hypothetical protein I305_05900 [Cryptococcus gattii E566]|uniref:Uncharacterized protein n=1 Tax=Cryptococcus gattii EJB2 TaxID=1296103 RepID=A0ABR5BM12_9TREE|nr:hypothetical protein I306_06302 [Cryptococcus gattii EJB2]KIY31659.1 hypothetical protein I305_05900 [Cryptococcus gattii E566]KJE01085.1 hypothetical protein I311_05254 [Cryptococcus gattii NT-10]
MHVSNLVALAALAGSAAALSINTPASIVECQPAALTFGEGTAPYIIAAIPGGQVSAAAIETINDNLSSSPYTWTVNLAAGTNITLKITDSTGTVAYSSPIVVQAGSSQACLNASASTSGLSSAAVTTTQSSVAGGAAATTSASQSSSAAASSSSSAASSSSASSSSAASSNAASTTSHSSAASSAATSAAATSAGSTSGAFPSAVVGVPALVAGLFAGVAALL